jgi:hypothetical protein
MIGNAPQIARRGYPRVTALAMLLGRAFSSPPLRFERKAYTYRQNCCSDERLALIGRCDGSDPIFSGSGLVSKLLHPSRGLRALKPWSSGWHTKLAQHEGASSVLSLQLDVLRLVPWQDSNAKGPVP